MDNLALVKIRVSQGDSEWFVHATTPEVKPGEDMIVHEIMILNKGIVKVDENLKVHGLVRKGGDA